MKNKLDLLYKNQIKELENLSDCSIHIISVGSHFTSEIYIRNKIKLLESLSCSITHTKMNEFTTQKELNDLIKNGINFTGQFVQLPLPEGLVEPEIPCEQDVDGFNLNNKKVLPCTVQACLDIMEYELGSITGLNIAILGRSNIVGLPLVNECIKRSATVTSFNSKSTLPKKWDSFDIVVSATGNRFLKAESFKNVKLVIDVGINRIDGKICGDIIHDNLIYKNITPVPFGVGKFTVLNVARNLKKIKRG